jgi:chromosome segregation ATPase
MDKFSIIVSGLEYKIKKIVDLQNQASNENQKLKQEIHEIKNIIEDQKVIITNLEEKIKVLKIAKTLEAAGKDNNQAKLKINELVREIDKCIALLNN